jgi:glucose/arabinose dehydrogenase
MRRTIRAVLASAAAVVAAAGCTVLLPSDGGGQIDPPPPNARITNAGDIALPEGYRASVVATGLTFPTQIAFDDDGRPYVTEAGYSYGEVFLPAQLLRLERGGRRTIIARSDNGPWTGVTFHDGAFYVAEGGVKEGGRILRITPDGEVRVLVSGLPSVGDHHTNGPAIGPDGWVYFSVGTATNSGVVGPDNAEYGWLYRFARFHDTPCEDIVLVGRNFPSADPLSLDGQAPALTGAYVPFNTPTTQNQVVRGALPCNGAVLRVRPEGGPVELVAWGFRNPFGVGFSPDGQLFVSDNGYDDRGSRPVRAAGDWFWRVQPGIWHGWPDFAGGIPLWEMEGGAPRVLAVHPNEPPRPVVTFGVHSSSNHFDFSRNSAFGYVGQAFVAQFGDQAPIVGEVLDPVGYKVVRVDVERGVVTTFAENRANQGPASKIGGGGLERPISARFNPDGTALYVVDFGVLTNSKEGSNPVSATGVVWRITRERVR